MNKISYLLFAVILVGCQDDKPIQDITGTAKVGQHLQLKAIHQTKLPDVKLDLHQPNGLITEIFLGDTIGYQYYVNGLKHGPYFSLFNKNFDHPTINSPADGMYCKGKKHGYFIRYHQADHPSYVAYYHYGDYQWGDYYGFYYEAGVHPRIPMKLSDEEITIEAPYPNGKTWYKGSFKNGQPIGVHKVYWTDGKKYGEVNYDKKKVKEIYHYEEGVQESDWTFEDNWAENWR